MIITCPNCATRYKINPASLGDEGRTVRCSSCGERWFVQKEAPEAAPKPAEPDPPPLREAPVIPPGGQAQPARAGGVATGAIMAWLLVLLVVLVIAGVVVGRNEVVAAFPQTASLYQRVGLPVTQEIGLELRNLVTEAQGEDGAATLTVTGEIHNVSGHEREVPPIRLAFLDADRKELAVEVFSAPQRKLPDGGMTRFDVVIDELPKGARNFSVTFDLKP